MVSIHEPAPLHVGYAAGGQQMAVGVLLTSILADVITNIHSFIIIATNHGKAVQAWALA